MAFTPKDNTGALFKNDKYEAGGKQPYYKGSARVNGQDMWVDGWLEESKPDDNGVVKKYVSLKLKAK